MSTPWFIWSLASGAEGEGAFETLAEGKIALMKQYGGGEMHRIAPNVTGAYVFTPPNGKSAEKRLIIDADTPVSPTLLVAVRDLVSAQLPATSNVRTLTRVGKPQDKVPDDSGYPWEEGDVARVRVKFVQINLVDPRHLKPGEGPRYAMVVRTLPSKKRCIFYSPVDSFVKKHHAELEEIGVYDSSGLDEEGLLTHEVTIQGMVLQTKPRFEDDEQTVQFVRYRLEDFV